MRALTSLIQPTGQTVSEDPYADLAPESAVSTGADSQQDWFSEFPDEVPAASAPVTTTAAVLTPKPKAPSFLALSRLLKTESR